MLVKNAENREQLEFVSLENMVPQDHLLRKIDDAIDFKKIYEFVEDLYCEDNGRPSVDPVVLFKIVLIQHIYGISSLRRTLEEVSMNLAYRWFIGYPLNEAVPHFSTVSYNFKHRFNHATVEYVFRWVLKAAAEEGYLDTEAIFVDGTHIKASANLKKQAKKAVPKQAKRYAKELFDEVNKDREEHGKKPFSDDSDKKPPEEKETVVSTTGSTKSALPTKRTQHVTSTILLLVFTSLPAISTTVQPLILCTMKYASITPSTKPWWRTAPTKHPGSARESSTAAAFFPPAIPAPRPKETATPGGPMCMTNTLTM